MLVDVTHERTKPVIFFATECMIKVLYKILHCFVGVWLGVEVALVEVAPLHSKEKLFSRWLTGGSQNKALSTVTHM